jgi:orotidine-5'-phosphate decarboxylase
MKTITVELNDEDADLILAMDKAKQSLAFKFVSNLEKREDWKTVFTETAEQAKKQGLTEEKLNELLREK